MHFKGKSRISEFFLLILDNSGMLISNMLMKFGHHFTISYKSKNISLLSFTIPLQYFLSDIIGNKFIIFFIIIVSIAKILETDDGVPRCLHEIRGHPFMTSTRRGEGSGSCGRGRGQAPCGRPHRKLKLESTDIKSNYWFNVQTFIREDDSDVQKKQISRRSQP